MYEKCPPRIAERLLRAFTAGRDRDCAIGDLAEEFRVRARHDAAAARRWYRSQVVRSLLAALGNWHPQTRRQARIPGRRGDGPMGNLIQDLRYGLRTLAVRPAFALLVVTTLGLAMGVNTAIFSILNVVLVRDLPLKEPDTLGFIYSTNPQMNAQQAPVPEADFLDYREEVSAFAQLAAVDRGAAFVLTGMDEPEWVEGFRATASTLEAWGQAPILGRWFTAAEDRPGGERVAVLAYGSWQRRFGGDPAAIGQVIELDGYPTTIIGVLPHEIEFGSLAEAEFWVPARIDRATASRENRNLWVSGRLAPGASHAQAQQEVDAVRQRIAAEDPLLQGAWGAIVYDMNRALAPPDTWMILFMLGLTVTFVMLIACSNVATLMLTRASARSREIAVRAALGAPRRRLLGQLLAESALLSLAAAILGLVVARLALMGLIWMAGENSGLDILQLVTLDRTVLLFTLGVAFVAPLLFGFVPALRASRPDLNEQLREGARGSSGGPGGLRGRRFLVATQVALALSLLVVAGLLMRTMAEQRNFDPGFEAERLLTMRVDLLESSFPTGAEQVQQLERLRAGVLAVPGIETVTMMGFRPGANDDPIVARTFRVEGQPEPDPSSVPTAFVDAVSAGMLSELGLPLRRGRGFTAADDADGAPVVIVNQHLAERFWDGDPVGTRIRLGAEPTWREVVGVTGDLHSGDPSNPSYPIVLLPVAQEPRRQMGFLARTAGPPEQLTDAVRQAVWTVDPNQPVADMRSAEQLIDDGFAAPQTLFSIFVAFAAFALAMAAAGIYGVMSFAVAERTREIGIRMALGARSASVLGMVTRQAAWLVGIGMLLGGVAALFLGRLLASAVAGVSATDPVVLGGVLTVFTLAAFVAAWVPARRAARIDPILALRDE